MTSAASLLPRAPRPSAPGSQFGSEALLRARRLGFSGQRPRSGPRSRGLRSRRSLERRCARTERQARSSSCTSGVGQPRLVDRPAAARSQLTRRLFSGERRRRAFASPARWSRPTTRPGFVSRPSWSGPAPKDFVCHEFEREQPSEHTALLERSCSPLPTVLYKRSMPSQTPERLASSTAGPTSATCRRTRLPTRHRQDLP